MQLVEKQNRQKLLLDFRDVECLDSRNLAGLVALNQKLKARGGWLTLSNANAQVLTALRIVGITRFFDIRG